MDMDSWTTLERLAGEAKAELEATDPRTRAEIDACETVMVLAAAAISDGTWTTSPDVLGAWLDRAKRIALAVSNGRELEESMYLPLDGADEPERILTRWLAAVPRVPARGAGGVRRGRGARRECIRDVAGALDPGRRHG